MRYQLTLRSENAKTGPIPVSTSPRITCPGACPLKGNGCYAEFAPLRWHWDKVSAGQWGDTWKGFLRRIRALPAGQLWRHNQAGDLPGRGNTIARGMLRELVAANRGRRGFTYTHKPMDRGRENRAAVRHANRNGFTVNLSADNLRKADQLADLGIGPVVTVLSSEQRANVRTPKGRLVVVCPAMTHEGVTCASCKLCAWADREVIVGFPAHGKGKGKVNKLVQIGG